jgi:hypothetical protein
MSVLQRTRTVLAAIEQRDKVKRAYEVAAVFRQRAGEIANIRETLRVASAKRTVLLVRSVSMRSIPSVTPSTELLREYRENLASSPREAGRVYSRLNRALSEFSNEVGETVAAAIGSVESSTPSIEESFLRAVERIPGYESKIAQIREERLRIISNVKPQQLGPDELAQFLDARARLQSLASELRPDEFPREVLAFFEAVRRGGLPLDRLTHDIREWLRVHDLLDRVRVTIV